eukprot:Rhum_TRINITY_DN14851_c7_g1::Rhum_TRINITY_DN14851_c7_g1_i1::g.122962::m.122962
MPDPKQARWVEDAPGQRCSACRASFTLLRRRHHCRACGQIYCASCSSGQLMLSGYRTAQRVCGLCMATHAAVSGKRGSGSSSANGGGPPSLHPSDACGQAQGGGATAAGTASEAAACTAEQRHLVGQLLTASARVRHAFPTGVLGERTRCVLNNGSTFAEGLGRGAPDWILGVEFDADEVWVRSMGLMLDVGRLAADRNLKELRKPLAEGALARGAGGGADHTQDEDEDCGGVGVGVGASSYDAEDDALLPTPAAAGPSSSSSLRRGIRCAAVSSSLNGVLQETVGVSVAGGGGGGGGGGCGCGDGASKAVAAADGALKQPVWRSHCFCYSFIGRCRGVCCFFFLSSSSSSFPFSSRSAFPLPLPLTCATTPRPQQPPPMKYRYC